MITWVRLCLALLALTLAAYALHALIGQEVPAANRDALMVALGIVLGLSKESFSFFFATSQSSAEKNALLGGKPDATGKAGDPVHMQDDTP